jgi:hypothetical protein
MNIYFAGAMRAGTQDADIYSQIIHLLSTVGKVLTEHVSLGPQEKIEDHEIFAQDMKWLQEAHIFVGEITVPSHGVGIEIRESLRLMLPTLCMHRAGARVSAMISGNPRVTLLEYDIDDLGQLTSEARMSILGTVRRLIEPIQLTREQWKPIRELAKAWIYPEELSETPPVIAGHEAEAITRLILQSVLARTMQQRYPELA